MPKTVTVSVPPGLGLDEARKRIEKGFGQLQQQLSGPAGAAMHCQYRWEGDLLNFKAKTFGMTMSGRIAIGDDVVRIDVDLPEILALVASKLKGRLHRTAAKLLEAK